MSYTFKTSRILSSLVGISDINRTCSFSIRLNAGNGRDKSEFALPYDGISGRGWSGVVDFLSLDGADLLSATLFGLLHADVG